MPFTDPATATAERIWIIVNPRAGAGRAGRRLEQLRRAADKVVHQWELKITEAPGHATHIAAEAAEAGIDVLAAVGGDGTCHEVVNGLFDGDRRRGDGRTAFSLIPFGTGSDLQRSLEIPSDLDQALAVVARGETRSLDVGLAELIHDGQPRQEVFINVAGFGANGEVVRRANRMNKRLGGAVTFLRASVQTAFAYQPPKIRLRWGEADGAADQRTWEGPMLSCFLANGGYCGGGMWVGRGGSMEDGRLDITILPPDPLIAQLTRARRLYDGSLESWPGARRFQTQQLEAEPLEDRPVHIDLDGELAGVLPARFQVLPQALKIRGGWQERAARS